METVGSHLPCERVPGRQRAECKGEGPRRRWQSRWAGEQCLVVDSGGCVSACVKDECLRLASECVRSESIGETSLPVI